MRGARRALGISAENVTLRNLELKDESFEELDFKNTTIDGEEAFREAVRAAML